MDENRIAKLAARQHGVVTTEQLRAAGVDRAGVSRRCRAGRLHRLYRGVYLVGHAVAPAGAAETAALLACGHGGVIRHASAAHLWNLSGFHRPVAPVEVTVAEREPRRRPGLRIHCSTKLHPLDIRRIEGIPVTAPGRTLVDLARAMSFNDLETVLADARGRRLLHDKELPGVLERNRHRSGAGILRRLVELDQAHGLTPSAAERRMLEPVRAAALPMPRANARVEGFEVDLVWQTEKVLVEVDGHAFHAGRRAFERDRERDATLAARGYVVLRVTWRQLVASPAAVVARLAATLSARS